MKTRRLIVSIVPDGKGQGIAEAAVSAGASGGTLLPARGTAQSTFLAVLGLGSSDKDIVLTIVDGAAAPAVCEAVRAKAAEEGHRAPGLLFAIDVLAFARSGDPTPTSSGDTTMQENAPASQVINVIVNKNYADEAMAAARTAGARGGTVLAARGTAKPDDAKFFGVPLVPEKEVLVIHVSSDKADAVFRAICALPCFAEKGSGIAFRLPVCETVMLGSEEK